MHSSITGGLLERQRQQNQTFISQIKENRVKSLQVSSEKAIDSAHKGGLTSLELDSIDHRYLLGAAADASIAGYDVQMIMQEGTPQVVGRQSHRVFTEGCSEHRALFKVDRTNPDCHKFSVTSAVWYPVDTGMFVTGSFDQEVKIWDTNVLAVACSFALPVRVYALGMSHVAAAHCLVAVGGGEPQVKLCDPASGAFTHSLVGHREAVWALHWSLSSEWHLITGSCDGQVRLWDIRTSGCVHNFDQHDTHVGPRSSASRPAQHRTAHDGAVTAVVPTPDGMHCLTAGTDSRLRLWDLQHNSNTLVNYPNTFNRAKKGRQIAVSADAHMVFHPSGSVIQKFDIFEGNLHALLRGHMDTVNACCYNPTNQELYTGSNDCQIIAWAAPRRANEEVEGEDGDNEDTWSD
ncbi:WD40 repeat-like protein [Coccomyxa subellipsoidea C-169]|uniref:WD40 repeat-like protein n=1 Tax=Coccomyxa subellipsoidea (strain C-169) TaxID=574566 RepID=I0YR84_COCSC|nr:WD40 repeat-like protein [Coccomyxa subellipsoidea C-169]EIE20903.1 WD40 repeat-like protein [Coccomyxa subellipsoidea C-169]|eukprot:XP_005645447.1 WD40 repeat-like protein [Coccomyxa subellipsoidea C-169]